MFRLFNLPSLPWASSTDGDKKVELTFAEVESLQSEIADAEERESQLQAKLDHVDDMLKFAHLAGYLYIRTRWTALPGELPAIDDAEVDDWLSRFVVFDGTCIFYYLKSTDLSPQESTLLSDVIEVGSSPSVGREDPRHAFYILTRQGLRYECSSISKVQVNSWLTALQAANSASSGAAKMLPG